MKISPSGATRFCSGICFQFSLATLAWTFAAVGVMPGGAVKFLATFSWTFASFREMPVVALAEIVVVVYMAVEMFMTVKPWTRTYEEAAVEPFRAVVAIRCAAIGRNLVVTIGTNRRRPDLNGNLSVCLVAAGGYEEGRACES
jgi:hypothetical protein